MLEVARRDRARFLLTSTSECYGDPEVHPQVETYWGNVNPVGPRSCYDESKRYAEAMTMAYHRVHGVRTAIARIFNTYGPRMALDDGRVVPAFVDQALHGRKLTIYGDGSQTRSFCYVKDLVEGLVLLLFSEERYPVNLGNPREMTILQFAEHIREAVDPSLEFSICRCRRTIRNGAVRISVRRNVCLGGSPWCRSMKESARRSTTSGGRGKIQSFSSWGRRCAGRGDVSGGSASRPTRKAGRDGRRRSSHRHGRRSSVPRLPPSIQGV